MKNNIETNELNREVIIRTRTKYYKKEGKKRRRNEKYIYTRKNERKENTKQAKK